MEKFNIKRKMNNNMYTNRRVTSERTARQKPGKFNWKTECSEANEIDCSDSKWSFVEFGCMNEGNSAKET